MYKYAYLVMVTGDNNNKFYEMQWDKETDNTFVSKYGRVNKTSTDETYHISKWDAKYKEKIKKGYKDVTSLRAVSTTSSTFRDMNDTVAYLMNKLQAYSKNTVKTNYTISVGAVTALQLQAAQHALDEAANLYEELKDLATLSNSSIPESEAKRINSSLLELYMVLPRQMDDVRTYLVQDYTTFDMIAQRIGKEQDILDSLATQVSIHNVDDKADQTLVEALGLEVELVTDSAIIAATKKMMTHSAHLFNKLYKINNKKTRSNYGSNIPSSVTLWEGNQKQLFHSSRNTNWLSILQNGLLIRPSGAVWTGSMLGDAIYFADDADKSIGYSSLQSSRWANGSDNEAYLAIYNVYLGKKLHLQSYADLQNHRYNLEYNKLDKLGYNSVFADASRGGWLRKNEYTIYHPCQCTIEYLIELKG